MSARLRLNTWRLPFSAWHLLLAPIAIVFALPLLWIVLSSFMSNAKINQFQSALRANPGDNFANFGLQQAQQKLKNQPRPK